MSRKNHLQNILLVSIQKRLFCPNSSLLSKFNHRNISYMPAVKFLERLDLEQNSSFLDGHQLILRRKNNLLNLEAKTNLLEGLRKEITVMP